MKTTVDIYKFHDAFVAFDRQDQITRPARVALFEYLEGLESDTGQEIELDVVALCCDWSEHVSAIEAASEYGWDPDVDETDRENSAISYLRDNTTVIEFDGGILVESF